MLSINLQQIVEEINSRRNRIRYPFQELGMMLTTKLNDPRHKALYMKLAKFEEQELLMDAMHYVLATPNISGNVGALFMWKLKELKNRPLQPLPVRFDTDKGYFLIGMYKHAVRGDMPVLLAGIYEFLREQKTLSCTILEKKSETGYLVAETFVEKYSEFSRDFLRTYNCAARLTMNSLWMWKGEEQLTQRLSIVGTIKLGVPVLTKRFVKGRMPST
ncbi:MAG: hypothetical protein QY312_03670 [Candidatus Dojkabacteria bacterium]|nr:MAG: hypothetical protein QY312_03670 [Candidatus Dojkabacteria bacterium]